LPHEAENIENLAVAPILLATALVALRSIRKERILSDRIKKAPVKEQSVNK
jgi:hypothetical protein